METADPGQILAALVDWPILIGFVLGIALGWLIAARSVFGAANGILILVVLFSVLPVTTSLAAAAATYMAAAFWEARFDEPSAGFLGSRVRWAVTTAFAISFVAAMVHSVVKLFFGYRGVLELGPAEFFGLFLVIFCAFIGFIRQPPLKTLAALMLGFSLAVVGIDQITGELRLVFGSVELLRGFDIVAVAIGLFGVAEIIREFVDVRSAALPEPERPRIRKIPAVPAALMMGGYLLVTGLLTNPVDAAAELARILAAPQSLDISVAIDWDQLGITYLLVLGLLIAGAIAVVTIAPLFSFLRLVPLSAVASVLLVLGAAVSYMMSNAYTDLAIMLAFGVIGYVFIKLEYSRAALLIALVLGDRFESGFRTSLLISEGKLSIFWSNWLVTALILAALAILCRPLFAAGLRAIRQPRRQLA